jgi:Zn-dependent metalloprotease
MCFIVPSHIFTSILENGTTEQKSFAAEVLNSIKSFALERERNTVWRGLTAIAANGKNDPINRSIYDAEHRQSLPGKLVRKEGDADTGDISVAEAYDGSGWTHKFFQEILGRNSIDDNGMELISTVHFGRNYGNAFWNGKSMTYGDGDGQIFNRFTSVIDVIGHELTHGVTEHTAGLIYRAQPGALNEHMSDVFGSLVKQYSRKQTAKEADWLIGEGLFTKKVNGRALRDMLKPGTAYDDARIGKDPQPDHMSKFVKTNADAGGVHINSGIPNRAFANAAINIGGYAWEKAGKIWYETLKTELKENSQFQDCVNATIKVAGRLYGDKSVEKKAVVEGWAIVGLKEKKSWWH